MRTNKKLVGLANSFAGGIFLSAGFLHIIPEATELLEDGKETTHADFPWVLFTIVCSFGLILFIDRVVLPAHSGHGHGHDGHSHQENEGQNNDLEHNHQHDHHSVPRDEEVNRHQLPSQQSPIIRPGPSDLQPEVQGLVEITERPLTEAKKEEPTPRPEGLNAEVAPLARDAEQTQAAQRSGTDSKKPSVLGPYTILVAMGLHAVFEGLALGLTHEFSSFIGFLIAILLHKWAESMAVGISFFKNRVPKWKRLAAFVLFALLTPIGVIIGLLVKDSNKTAQAIVLSLSGGTFLYISVAEIIVEEFGYKDGIFWRFLVYWVVIAVNVLTWYLETRQSGKQNTENHTDH